MDVQQEVKNIEDELATIIIHKLRENKIEYPKAQQLAKDFLAVLPINDQKDLLEKLKHLSGSYEEVKEIYAEELGKYNDEEREKALLLMRNAIHAGNIDQAITVAKSLTQ